MDKTLGKRIAALRKNQGLTQDQLAEQLGVTAQAVSKWEHDQSCPDITMLPKLAEIFGTTTDALLGIETVREAEVVQEAPEEKEENGFHFQNDAINIHIGSERRGSLSFAIWVLLFGGLLLASSVLGLSVGWWSLCWPSCMLVFGLMGLIHKFSFLDLGMTFFGGYFLAGNFLPLTFQKDLVIPLVIVLLGLSLLADALRKPKKNTFKVGVNREAVQRNAFQCSGEQFLCSTSFGEGNRKICLDRLSGGRAAVSFGELTVDLSGCLEIAPGCTLELSCSFGELNLLVPKTCRIVHSASTSFADVDISGRPNEDAQDLISLECSANFGEISVKYI